jgi:hypothetical protein
MTYVNEDSYHPAMVPVVENTTIGKNIIYVRGLMEITESMNDGESFAQAICKVLDVNQLETFSSILAVDAYSCLVSECKSRQILFINRMWLKKRRMINGSFSF